MIDRTPSAVGSKLIGLRTNSAGTQNGMRHPNHHHHLRAVPAVHLDAEHVLVETDEHEIIGFDGCSEAEVEAKLRDYLAWAS